MHSANFVEYTTRHGANLMDGVSRHQFFSRFGLFEEKSNLTTQSNQLWKQHILGCSLPPETFIYSGWLSFAIRTLGLIDRRLSADIKVIYGTDSYPYPLLFPPLFRSYAHFKSLHVNQDLAITWHSGQLHTSSIRTQGVSKGMTNLGTPVRAVILPIGASTTTYMFAFCSLLKLSVGLLCNNRGSKVEPWGTPQSTRLGQVS